MAHGSSGFRREFVAGVGTIIAATLTGCSSSGDSPEDGESESGETTPNTATPTSETTEGTTASDKNTTSGQGSGISALVEADEPQIEEEYEAGIDQAIPNEGWIEMENPGEQIPRENYDFEAYPNLQLLVDEGQYFDAYDPENEAVYLMWVEYDGKVGLTAFQVKDYDPDSDGSKQSAGSDQYTDQSADIEGILREVVEGVDDVPDDLDEEYVELLT